MSPEAEAGIPGALWEYLARQVKPAVEELYEESEASDVLALDIYIEFEGADAANVGRLLDYLDFMFRWTESVVDSLQYPQPPSVIEPKYHKVPVFEIISTQSGSFLVRLRAVTATTILVVTNLLNLFNAAAEAVDHVNDWRHAETTVQTEREGKGKIKRSLPSPEDEVARQAWLICGRPESFVEMRAHAKTADGVDWEFSAKWPAHASAHDEIYMQQIKEVISELESGE